MSHPLSASWIASSLSNTTSSYEPHLSSVSTPSSAPSSSSMDPNIASAFEAQFGGGRLEKQLTVVEHRTRPLLLFCRETQFVITEEGRLGAASAVTDLLPCPNSCAAVPLRSVFGEIRLWQIWADSGMQLGFSFASAFRAISPGHGSFWQALRGILNDEALLVVSVLSFLIQLGFSFFLSAGRAEFSNTGLTMTGVYRKKTRY